MKEPVLLPPTHDSLLGAFRTYLSGLGLSSISRKLYSADIARLLSSRQFASLTLEALSNPKNYLTYLSQPDLSSSTTLLRRSVASIKQFGLFLSHSFSIPNPTQNLTLSTNHGNIHLSATADKYIKSCLQYLKDNHLSESSLRSYKSDITQYLIYLESHNPSTHISTLLNEKNVQIYTDLLTHLQTQSPATIERKLKTIRRFINWYLQSTPQPILSDNIKIAANLPKHMSLTQTVPSLITNPATDHADSTLSSNTSPDHKQLSVKNANYRKFRLPTLRNLVSAAILLVLISTLSIFSYRQFGRDASLTAAFPNTPITPNRQLSFQGRLENASGTPITSATNFVFKLFDASSGGTELYSSGTCSITPDTDGVFSIQIGGTCGSGISSNVFTENQNVWLEVTVGAETLTPRQQIATVAYALNSETIQGFPISATVSAIRNTVVPMNQWGEIIVGEQSPRLKGVSGTFQISAPSLSLVTAAGTNGNITLAPDGTGQVNLNGNTTTTNFFNVSNAQLTTGSLITGTAANNNSGFKLLDLLSGSSPTSKFSVTDAGNVTLAGDLTISGDDLFMNTNTSGFILVADGTNYNPVAVSGDITINSSGVTTIGADKITEGMLKSVNSPSDELCLSYETSGGGDFEWQTCGGGGSGSNWRFNLGTISPNNDTVDLLVGGNASSSAKFAVLNVNSGTPTASVSAGTAGGAYLTATGTLATTAKQTLTLGNSTTGNVIIAPGGTTALTAIGTNLTAANAFTVTGTLTANGVVALGDNGDTVTIDSSDWDITATGDMSGIGTITSDGDWTNSQGTPSIFLTDTTASADDYSINVDANNFDITNATDSRIELQFTGAGGINLGDNTATKTIGIGGNTNSSSDTINIATNATAADVITIGNSNASTTLALTGGDDWSIATNGNLITLGSAGIGTTGPDAKIDSLSTSGEQLRLTYADGSTYTSFTTNSVGDLTIAPSGGDLAMTANATVSGNVTMGGQLQLGRFAATPTAIGAGTMIFDSTNNVFKCYNGTSWFNCGGTLFSNTNASVADGSYITVTHNLATNDLLSSAWINAQGVWKSLDAAYRPAIAWEGKDTQKGIYHNSVNTYQPVGNETGTSNSTLQEGMVFDTFEDSAKTDSANTTSSLGTQLSDDGASNYATLVQRIQGGRVGLMGGQTLDSSTLDNDGQTYLGSNTVNDMYYYDRTKDSTPEVLVELGIDPNWYNGVTLSVATGSSQLAQSGTIADKNPNLTTTYNGSLIKATGTDSTPRTIFITIKSPTTFDWTNYQGDTATGVTITPGTAQTLGSTGVSVTFTGGVSYNVGDVFKIASWYIEAEGTNRGAKQQFPERSYVIATANGVDIIDADTQKLWMGFDAVSSAPKNIINANSNTIINTTKALNGMLYAGQVGASGTGSGVSAINFTTDGGKVYFDNGTYTYGGSIAQRNSTLGITLSSSSPSVVTSVINDIDAAVIPNQPTQEITVSGWGYFALSSTQEIVNLPYTFNNNPRIVVAHAGYQTTVPTSLSNCTNSSGRVVTAENSSTNYFQPTLSTGDASNYHCYTWTATGTVSPKQFVVVATGAASADGGTTIINDTDGSSVNVMVGSQDASTVRNTKVAIANNAIYAATTNTTPLSWLSVYYGLHGSFGESTYVAYRSGYYYVNLQSNGWSANGLNIAGATAADEIKSLYVTPNTSVHDPDSSTIYVGTTTGMTVINEKRGQSYSQSTSSAGDGTIESTGSVKYYTKDYITDEMIGDIRGMWPLSSNGSLSMNDASIKGNTLTNRGSATAVSGIRGVGVSLNGSSQYLTRNNDSDFDLSSQLSFGGWIKTSTTGTAQMIMGRIGSTGVSCAAPGTSSTNAVYEVYVDTTNVAAVAVRDNTDGTMQRIYGNKIITDGQWHQVIGIVDKSNSILSLYVDGILDSSATLTETGTYTFDDGLYIGAYCDNLSATSLYFNGSLDDMFITATALNGQQSKNMYQVGYRALQSHGTSLGGGSADANQQLGYISTGTSSVGIVQTDYNNQYMYVGLNSTTLGGLSKIQLNSDTNIKTFNSSANVPSGGALLIDEDITSLAVGETLYAVGSAASGVKSMGLDNNATATSGNFVSRTQVLPKNIGSAVLWVSPILDSSDGSNTITVQASNDGGSTYSTCTLVNTNSNYTVPEKEYACTFTTADNDLKVRFQFARGSTKTNTYVVQYGISWLGETGFRVEQLDNNNTRLYNFSGETQNLKLNVTGASTSNLASPWTDAGSYLYPTGYETIRIYDGAGSNYLSLSDTYINFGATSGSSGYGIRDNAGTMEFKNSAGSWTALGAGGASWWDQVSGTIQPYNKTVDLLLGGTATSSAKFGVLNINSGTPTATISAGATGSLYMTATGTIATTAKQTLALGDSTTTGNIILQGGNVGIGVASPTQKLEVNGYIVGQRFEDSASSAYYLDPAATGTSLSIDGNIVGNGAFYISTGNDAVAVSIGTTGAGKLDAGTIDPPYTINGEKFATYMSGMTGVKEETTGSTNATEHIAGKGYRATLDLANSIKGSDLWLFKETTQLQSQLDQLVVLTTAAGSGKTWYEVDANSGKIYLYSTTPTRISYRLTAPRFDADSWANTRDSASLGFVVNNPTEWSVSNEIASLYNQMSEVVSSTITNLLSTNVISPLADGDNITITAPVAILPSSNNPDLPTLVVDGEIEATTISARLAQLESIQAENITAKNIVAETISANSIVGLDAKIATFSSGMSDADLYSITTRIKNRLAEITNPTTATDVPVPEDIGSSQLSESITNTYTATSSATMTTADIDFATINDYLAVIGTATITDLSVTNNIYANTINSQSGVLALQNLGGLINLGNNTLIVDSTGSVAINGDLYVNGRILAESASLNNIELGNAPDSTSSSALGNLLSVYNESGETVATIDASGSANLASLTTNMITIASAGSATDSSALSTLTGITGSNATAGNATLKTPNTELTISSPYVTANSLVYLTPTTNTDNKVLFVKAKDSCQNSTPTCTPSFTVGIDALASTDISFNWWIIELKQ